MYDKIRELLENNQIVKFTMHGESAAFREDEGGEILFTINGDNIICYATDIDSAIDCLMDECDEDELAIID